MIGISGQSHVLQYGSAIARNLLFGYGNGFNRSGQIPIHLGDATFLDRTLTERQVSFYNVSNPDREILERMEFLWNSVWRYGIPELGPSHNIESVCIPDLERSLLVDFNQIASMQKASPGTIIIASDNYSGDIEAAIWGRPIMIVNDRIPETYKLLTVDKTLAGVRKYSEDNARACYSVVVNPPCHGWRTKAGTGFGQEMVFFSLKSVIAHSHQYRIVAYSRPSSMKMFAELLLWIYKKYGILITYDKTQASWVAISSKNGAQNSISYDVKILENGVKISGKVYSNKAKEEDDEKMKRERNGDNIVRVSRIPSGYIILPDWEEVFITEQGVTLGDIYIDLEAYLDTPYDQMKRFHGGRGGDIKWTIEMAKEDPIAFNYIVGYEFPILELMDIDNFSSFTTLLAPLQMAAVRKSVINPDFIVRALKRTSNPNAVIDGFSVEKWKNFWLPWIEKNRRDLRSLYA